MRTNALLLVLITVLSTILGYICLIPSEPEEIEVIAEEEDYTELSPIQLLLGEDIKETDMEDVYLRITEDRIEVFDLTTSKRYSYATTLKLREQLDASEYHERSHKANGINNFEKCFTIGNYHCTQRSDILLVDEFSGNKIINKEEVPLQGVIVLSRISSLLEDIELLSQSTTINNLLLTTNFEPVCITARNVHIIENREYKTYMLPKGVFPEMDTAVDQVYLTMDQYLVENADKFNSYSINNYRHVIPYGEYILCIDNTEKQMLFNYANNSFEWMVNK